MDPNVTRKQNEMDKLRMTTLAVAVISGISSVSLMLLSGLRPPSFLIVLFIGWVLAPFAGLVLGILISPRWKSALRNTIYVVTYVLATCSLAIYGFVLAKPLSSQPAFPYVAVPIGSWLLIAIVLPLAVLISRRQASE